MGWEQVEILVEKFEGQGPAHGGAPLPVGESVNGQGVALSSLLSTLSRLERARAERFRFARDRDWYVWRQARLRRVLGERLGCGAEEVEYAVSDQGKPRLGGRFAGVPLRFSLSHSDGLLAIALSEEGEVGVDVERVRELSDLEALAKRCFSAGEWERFQQLGPEEQGRGFFRLWTRKEAVLKAIGTGLLVEPNRVTVDEPGLGERGVFRVSDPRDGGGWWVKDIVVPEGWLGSLSISAG